jgi:hypothetical protein
LTGLERLGCFAEPVLELSRGDFLHVIHFVKQWPASQVAMVEMALILRPVGWPFLCWPFSIAGGMLGSVGAGPGGQAAASREETTNREANVEAKR